MHQSASQRQSAILNCMFNWLIPLIDKDVDGCAKNLHIYSMQFLIICLIG